MNKQDRIIHLLKKYVQRRATDEERRMVDAWIDQTETSEIPDRAHEISSYKEDLRYQIERGIIKKKKERQTKTMLIGIFVCLLVGGYIGYFYRPIEGLSTRSISVRTEMGQKKRVLLSDGTVVLLNSESEISYLEGLGMKERKVRVVRGEVYFDVAKDTKRSFMVEAFQHKTEVLGTSFSVRASQETTMITVTSGKVRVSGQERGQPIILKASEQVVLKAHYQEKKKVNVVNVTAYNRLDFNNERLGLVSKKIMDNYGIVIHMASEQINGIKLSASFNLTDDPKDVVYELAKAGGLSYAWKNKEVTLY